MLVCVDHGNKQIKTASRVFTSGLVESDTRPPFGDNILCLLYTSDAADD